MKKFFGFSMITGLIVVLIGCGEASGPSTSELTATKAPPEAERFARYTTFREYCEDYLGPKDNKTFRKHKSTYLTVSAIYGYVRRHFDRLWKLDCAGLDAKLNEQKYLDLSGETIETLHPLRVLKNVRDLEIGAHDLKVLDFTPLLPLKKVSENEAENLRLNGGHLRCVFFDLESESNNCPLVMFPDPSNNERLNTYCIDSSFDMGTRYCRNWL